MAKEESKGSPKAAPKKKRGRFRFFMSFFALCAAMPFTLPSVLLILAGLTPTYVAYATDKDSEKVGATSVCAMNLAGIVPFVIDLWGKGQTLENAFHILTDPNAWFVILAASGVGQLVVYVVPQALATLFQTNAEARISALRKNLEILKESWGAEVASAKAAEKKA